MSFKRLHRFKCDCSLNHCFEKLGMKLVVQFSWELLFCILLTSWAKSAEFKKQLQENSNRGGGNNRGKAQRAAVESWARSLSEYDYNASEWARTMRKQPQNFFDAYSIKVSEIFRDNNANVNFMLVGACDGTNDNTIRDRFLPYNHWQGLFVEPVSRNYEDLVDFLERNKVSERSHAIQAAVTSVCEKPTVTMKASVLEDSNPNASHWQRRQIGSIVKPDAKLSSRWKLEEVACMTPNDLKAAWAEAIAKKNSRKKKPGKRRVHILKIDAEGFDFQVLMGFITKDVPTSELPFIINYEAKSMFDNLPVAKAALEERGYVVSLGNTNDGFALLRADKILQSSTKGSKKAAGGGKKKRRKKSPDGEDGEDGEETGGEGGGEEE